MTDDGFIAALAAIVGTAYVLTSNQHKAPYLTDWRKRYTGQALAVVKPNSTSEIVAIVRLCADTDTVIVPQGGNTGLVGGATPQEHGQRRTIVLNLQRLNRIRALDVSAQTITVEAGCVLADIQQAARNAGKLFPLSLASQGSCTIGGNLSTNAGGTAVLRYGNTRDLCLGLEVVSAQGTIIGGHHQSIRALRKDNTGYDLKQWFIGAEGTLGIISAAVMKLYPLPRAQVTALIAVGSVRQALDLFTFTQERCTHLLSAFELISDCALQLVEKHFPPRRSPFFDHRTRPAYVVLLEISDHEDQHHALALVEELMQQAVEKSSITNGVIAQNLAQAYDLWQLRELISEAQAREGRNIKHDIALPISAIADFIEVTDALLEQQFPGVRIVNFGHLGDGNLHYNLSRPPDISVENFLAQQTQINQLVYERVDHFCGSISAEHGIGQLKCASLQQYKSASDLSLMRTIKMALDPLNIMNPGKVIT